MKSPAFQFYVQDFLIGTAHFTAEETGAYIRLLCYQWDNGFIEDDDQKLKKISGISVKKMENILKKFSKSKDGQLKNIRLEKERKKQLDLRKRRSDAGKKGNEIKYGPRKAIAKGSQSDRKGVALQSSSSSSTSVNTGGAPSAEEEPYYQIFRRCTPSSTTNELVLAEVKKFRTKYPDMPANRSGPLINEWAARMNTEAEKPSHLNPKKNKNVFV